MYFYIALYLLFLFFLSLGKPWRKGNSIHFWLLYIYVLFPFGYFIFSGDKTTVQSSIEFLGISFGLLAVMYKFILGAKKKAQGKSGNSTSDNTKYITYVAYLVFLIACLIKIFFYGL